MSAFDFNQNSELVKYTVRNETSLPLQPVLSYMRMTMVESVGKNVYWGEGVGNYMLLFLI